MIVDLLIDAFGLLVDLIVLVLPAVEIPGWSQVMATADWLNTALFAYDGLLPIAELVTFYRWVATVWGPGYLAFVAVKWIWAHVPVLGSGGS